MHAHSRRVDDFFDDGGGDEDRVTYQSSGVPLSFRRTTSSREEEILAPSARNKRRKVIVEESVEETVEISTLLVRNGPISTTDGQVGVDLLFQAPSSHQAEANSKPRNQIVRTANRSSTNSDSLQLDRPSHWTSGHDKKSRPMSLPKAQAQPISSQRGAKPLSTAKSFASSLLPQPQQQVNLGRPAWMPRRAEPVVVTPLPPRPMVHVEDINDTSFQDSPPRHATTISRGSVAPGFNLPPFESDLHSPADATSGLTRQSTVATPGQQQFQIHSSPVKKRGKSMSVKEGSLQWKLQKVLRSVSSVETWMSTPSLAETSGHSGVHDPRSRCTVVEGVVFSTVANVFPYQGVNLLTSSSSTPLMVLLTLQPSLTLAVGDSLVLYDPATISLKGDLLTHCGSSSVLLCVVWSKA